MPQQYRQCMFIRSRFSLCILQKFMFCCELAFPITPYARLLQQCLLLWVGTISIMGTKLLTNILMTSLFHNTLTHPSIATVVVVPDGLHFTLARPQLL